MHKVDGLTDLPKLYFVNKKFVVVEKQVLMTPTYSALRKYSAPLNFATFATFQASNIKI